MNNGTLPPSAVTAAIHCNTLETPVITDRVECGGEYSVLVTDNGILMTCGRGDRGVQGHHDNQDCLKPKLVEDLITHDVVQVLYNYHGICSHLT